MQIVYEHNVRPAEKLHAPWVQRVTGQMLAAYDALEAELQRKPLAVTSEIIDQAGVTTAVVWHFTQMLLPEVVPVERFPTRRAFSAQAEQLATFKAAPHGDSTYREADDAPNKTVSSFRGIASDLTDSDIAREPDRLQ